MSDATVIEITKPAPPAIVAELTPIVRTAQAFEVLDVATDAEAQERAKSLRAGEKRIEDYFEPSRKAADQAKKEILAARDGLIGPFAAARRIYDEKSIVYQAEERRKAEEQQRQLQERARKEEEDRKLMDAIDAENRGEKAEAEAILAEPVVAPVVMVAPAVAQVKGVATRTVWSAEVVDLQAFIRYVAAHPEWSSLLEPAMPNLNRLAVAQRQAFNIPGVRAVSTQVRSSRIA